MAVPVTSFPARSCAVTVRSYTRPDLPPPDRSARSSTTSPPFSSSVTATSLGSSGSLLVAFTRKEPRAMPDTASLARTTATRWSLWFGGQSVHPAGGSPPRTGGALSILTSSVRTDSSLPAASVAK